VTSQEITTQTSLVVSHMVKQMFYVELGMDSYSQ